MIPAETPSVRVKFCIPHSGRHEAAVGEPGDTVVVTVLLQKDTALPGEDRRRATKVEIVDFDRFARAVARGVQAEAPGRRFGEAQTVDIEGLQVQRPRTVRVGARVVLQLEGGAVDELRLRPCRRIDQIHVTGRTMTRRKQKTGRPQVQDVFRDTSHRCRSVPARRDKQAKARCLRAAAGGDVRDSERRLGTYSANEKNDGNEDPTLQRDHAAPSFCLLGHEVVDALVVCTKLTAAADQVRHEACRSNGGIMAVLSRLVLGVCASLLVSAVALAQHGAVVHVPADQAAEMMQKGGQWRPRPTPQCRSTVGTDRACPRSAKGARHLLRARRRRRLRDRRHDGRGSLRSGQLRGTGIDGGQTMQLKKGDVVLVPAGTPHWLKEVKSVVFYTVRAMRP